MSAKAWNAADDSDESLMARLAAESDPDAMALLMNRWRGPIERLGQRMLGDLQRGQDIAQEAFVRVYSKRAEYAGTGKFSSYLWRIALNLCYNEIRRLKRRSEESLDAGDNPISDTMPSLDASPDEQIGLDEQAGQVRAALLRLPEEIRVVLVLRHYENLKFREVAEVLDIPESTVKSRLFDGLDRMGRDLRQGALSEKWKARRIEFSVL